VADRFLDDAQVGVAADVLGGEGVPQRVGRGAFYPGEGEVLLNHILDAARPQPPLELGEEAVLVGDGGPGR